MNHFLSDIQASICITINIHICKFVHNYFDNHIHVDVKMLNLESDSKVKNKKQC